MAYEYDAFLSCASEDLKFARDLTALMKRAGVRVWFYEEENQPGVDVQESLRQGIDRSRHAVLLISEPWIRKKYTFWEVRVLSELGDPTRRMVPIARRPMKARDLPAELSHLNVLDCDWNVQSCYALLWLVLCGILETQPGPRAEWADRGRSAIERGAASLPTASAAAVPSPRPLIGATVPRPVLRLDRRAQWEQVRGEITATHGQLWLVWGDHRQAQEIFLQRIKLLLPKTGPRSIVPVRWNARMPASRPEFRAALARAIDVPGKDLVDGLKARVADSDLVLVHEPVFEMSQPSEPLLSYYTEWIPELLDEVDPNASPTDRVGNIRVVQALGFRRPRGVMPLATTLRWLGLSTDWTARETEVSKARAFVKQLKKNESRRLPVVVLNELEDVTVEDIRMWTHELSEAGDREALLQSLTRRGLDTAGVFDVAATALAGMGRVDDE